MEKAFGRVSGLSSPLHGSEPFHTALQRPPEGWTRLLPLVGSKIIRKEGRHRRGSTKGHWDERESESMGLSGWGSAWCEPWRWASDTDWQGEALKVHERKKSAGWGACVSWSPHHKNPPSSGQWGWSQTLRKGKNADKLRIIFLGTESGGCTPLQQEKKEKKQEGKLGTSLREQGMPVLPWWTLKSPWRFSAAHKYSLQRIQ